MYILDVAQWLKSVILSLCLTTGTPYCRARTSSEDIHLWRWRQSGDVAFLTNTGASLWTRKPEYLAMDFSEIVASLLHCQFELAGTQVTYHRQYKYRSRSERTQTGTSRVYIHFNDNPIILAGQNINERPPALSSKSITPTMQTAFRHFLPPVLPPFIPS